VLIPPSQRITPVSELGGDPADAPPADAGRSDP